MKLKRELLIAQQMTDINVITQNYTVAGPDQFTEKSTSTPETLIQDAISEVRLKIGRRPNRLMIGYNVLQSLKTHPWAVNQYNGIKVLSEEAVIDLLKTHFRLKSVVVGEAVAIQTELGQTNQMSDVWGNDMVLYYTPDTPSLFTPSFSYCFKLKGGYLRTTTRRHTNDIGEMVKIEAAYQDYILDTNAGFLLKDCVETPNL